MINDRLLPPDNPLLTAFDSGVVRDAWSRFVDRQDSTLSGVREEIAQSWRRSAAAGLSARSHRPPHIGDDETLAHLRDANQALIDSTKRTWELLAVNLLESEGLLVVTDATGKVLDIHGNAELVAAAGRENVAAGFDWSEAAAGTNAIGTALALDRPTFVRTEEHFCAAAKVWNCAAAPIRDLTDKTLLGVLDIASVGTLSTSHALGFAITAAQQIEHGLHAMNLGRTITLLSWHRGVEHRFRRHPSLLLDQKGRVIAANRRAYELLDAVPEKLPIVGGAPTAPENGEWQVGETTAPPSSAEGARPSNEGAWDGGIVTLSVATRKSRVSQHRSASAKTKIPPAFAAVITADPTFLECIDVAARLAQSSAPVLLTGETGSGKELFASAIHACSNVADGPFVAINCGTLSKELSVSELLGYEPGAFTGASPKGHAGKFEQADGGTIFLDEVGELPLDAQVHLLRVLQDNVVLRVGSARERRTNVRVIAATNRDLEAEVRSGRFRSDLYYRLKVLNLCLPPLRERAGDIALLARHFIRRLQETYGLGLKSMSPLLVRSLQAYHWPGNVRELHGVLERMYILSGSPSLTMQDLPDDVVPVAETAPGVASKRPPDMPLGEIEAEAIRAALSQPDLNLTQVASRLGISRTTLYRRMKSLGIGRPV